MKFFNQNAYIGLSLLVTLGLFSFSAQAEPLRVTQSISGISGLLEMPSARMLEEGEFGIHLSNAAPYSRYAVIGQPLPWLQVLFKYTDIENIAYGPDSLSGSQSYKDKSVDVKVQLFEESYYGPAVSVGINDVGGTGLFSGEYLVASKQIKNLDLTLGMGWGYLGSQGHLKNPFTLLSDHFNTRENAVGSGGTVDTGTFFSGEKVALFAGAEYHLETYPLVLKAEYDANNYQHEPFSQTFEQKIPLNFGAVYTFNNSVDLHLGYVRGTTAMLGLTFRTNLKSSGAKKILDPAPVKVIEKRSPARVSWEALHKDLQTNAGYAVSSVWQADNQLIVKGQQQTYMERAQGLGRAARILANSQADEIQQFVFVDEFNGEDISAIQINRAVFEKAAKLETDSNTILASSQLKPAVDLDSADLLYQSPASDFDYQIKPDFSGSFGGPDEFLLYQLSLGAGADYFLRNNTWLSGGLELGLIDNYDQFKYTAPSSLPRVRTNIKEYLKTSNLRLNQLQLLDLEAVSDDFFVMGYAGYLESMYGGLGGEMLYRPHGKQWALGLDANYVKQRDFDQKLGFREYSATTGHLTGYYETDSHMLVKLSAGQYLAKDRGVTMDISRKFRSGATMGFWATKTNVSAEEFGEGSFDKGFYFSMPMNLFTFKSTNDTAGFTWQFLTRDGGQKLNKKYELYDLTESRSLGYIKDSFENVLR
jgi:hypothetical protein